MPSCESVSVFFSLMDSTTFTTSSAAKVPEVLDDLIVGAYGNDQSNKSLAGRSYVVFGKQDNTNAIELSAIAAGTGGFILPADNLLSGSALQAFTIKSSKPSPLTSHALETDQPL
jgi:hypothetical protein